MKRVIEYISLKLSQPAKQDGRWIVVIILLLYFTALFYLAAINDSFVQAWRKLGVFALPATFTDFREMLTALDCLRIGKEEVQCVGKTWILPFILQLMKYTGWGENQTVMFGIVSIILFSLALFFFIGKINSAEAIFYGLVFCSPPVMLGLERGNLDIRIFILLSLTIFIFVRFPLWKWLSYFFILVCAFWKLHPIFSLLVSLREKFKIFLVVNILAVSLFMVALFSINWNSGNIAEDLSKELWISTGSLIFVDWLTGMLRNVVRLNSNVMHLAARTILILIVLFCFLQLKNKKNILVVDTNYLDSFRIGAGIFIGTFIFGYNFDYRLIFLIFTFPQILEWCKTENELRKISVLVLIGVIIYFQYYLYLGIIGRTIGNQNFVNIFTAVTFTAKEMIIWSIFTFYIYTIMLTFPVWVKKKIFAAK